MVESWHTAFFKNEKQQNQDLPNIGSKLLENLWKIKYNRVLI
jgi:hypothetical protein